MGLGSPKLEKAAATKVEEKDIPEEWKPVLYKDDGTRRKVILYNTSVGALLEHDECMLNKMKDVFRAFYENREDVALLWRPHPLIKATMESMRLSGTFNSSHHLSNSALPFTLTRAMLVPGSQS